MPKTKLRTRYEMKNVPEWAIKELRDYAEERGIERGEAFGEVICDAADRDRIIDVGDLIIKPVEKASCNGCMFEGIKRGCPSVTLNESLCSFIADAVGYDVIFVEKEG